LSAAWQICLYPAGEPRRDSGHESLRSTTDDIDNSTFGELRNNCIKARPAASGCRPLLNSAVRGNSMREAFRWCSLDKTTGHHAPKVHAAQAAFSQRTMERDSCRVYYLILSTSVIS